MTKLVQCCSFHGSTSCQDYDERVLPSIANEDQRWWENSRVSSCETVEVMKATIAQYNAESLLTQREQVGGKRPCFRTDFLGPEDWRIEVEVVEDRCLAVVQDRFKASKEQLELVHDVRP